MAYSKRKKLKKTLNKAEELALAKSQWECYTRARDNGHEEYIQMAKKCDMYYRGDQWDEFDMQELDDQGRPALTINTILPTINAVLGEQSTKKADIQFKPRGGGNQEIADVLTKVYQQIADNNKLDWVEGQVFSDGLIQDRGYFDVRIDFDDHLMGEVKIEAKDPIDILIDPDAKHYDPKTWNEIFESKWMSLDEIEETYGQQKADKLRMLAETGNTMGADSMEFEEERYGDTDEYNYGQQFPGDPENARMLRAIRVIERQYYRLKECMYYVDVVTGDMREVPYAWGKKKREDFADQFGLEITTKLMRKVRWTVTADTVVLFDDWSPYPQFTIVPYFPYFRRGKPFGMVRNLLSPQEQLNKITSQELHIVNTTANSGWIVENGSLAGMTADDLEEHGAETGLVLEFNRGSTPPAKIPPNQIPTGLDRLGQKAANNIKEISGISDAMLGMDSPEVSGVAINAKQNRGSTMLQVPLTNLAKTRQYLAESILKLVQTFYTEERVLQITDEEDPYKPRTPLRVNVMTPEGQVINDLQLGEYDVVVSSAPARDNFDEMQFAEAIALRQVGVPIPNDMIVEYSHLSRKADVADRIRQMEGTAPPTQEQMQLQQFQMESQIRGTQLEIAKLEAEVANLQTAAALNAAKTEQVSQEPQLKVAELQSKLQQKREELTLREKLSALTNDMRKEQSDTAAAAKMATEAMKNLDKPTGGTE
tara:strand:- start:16863 stop:18989 length:2127 start_codon:yes stop_codon:yes gene_type:complete